MSVVEEMALVLLVFGPWLSAVKYLPVAPSTKFVPPAALVPYTRPLIMK
jgi:hypothetical protein